MASYQADIEQHGGTVALNSQIATGHVSGTFQYAIGSGSFCMKQHEGELMSTHAGKLEGVQIAF